MFNQLTGPVQGLLSLLLYTCNTVFWVVPLFFVALAKLIIPTRSWRSRCSQVLNAFANNWVGVNNWALGVTKDIQWDVQGLESLQENDWYLVLSNHQSWVDILILQKVFHRKIPLLKFFLKKELIWVPFLGFAWWALDFPFMKRYSKEFLKKHPELRGKDIEITRRACDKFKSIPVSIMNFVEGTRFTRAKHHKQRSPYRYLLKPKAGGIAYVLAAMGHQMHKILNVTIAYPEGSIGFWPFVCGRVRRIRVRVDSLPVEKELIGDYFQDKEFSERFQEWINELWVDKDRRLQLLMDPQEASPQSQPAASR